MNDNEFGQQHIWHPYSAMHSDLPTYRVVSAHGVRLKLSDGRQLIDGMASWWCMIHGYNHPGMNTALEEQLHKMAHVMFGGLTHEPAVTLARQLVDVTPPPLQTVFFSDSGSVAVEVALKMAIQYWQAKGQPQRQRFIALGSGYHGDTLGAMSVCDPVTGMHSLFKGILPEQIFVDRPACRFGEPCGQGDIASLKMALEADGHQVAAVILEPIVQGAGGMWFYAAEYLKKARELCDHYGVLLIADEIATGFGRSGKLFACEHAGIAPDILCLGKALTGGYLTLAATLTTEEVAVTIDRGNPGVFMHGPTFMANPLACTAAITSIRLLLDSDWQGNISRIEAGLKTGLEPCNDLEHVNEVRILGAMGVVEMKQVVDMKTITQAFVEAGVWVRPFGKLVYLMPPYIISDEDLDTLTNAVVRVVCDQ
ncbi:MAG TPA: adenosylmethionine--8-amino-7-oxononanoate transaminase [Acidiferrobacteraceae bacterium]|nr:adenosylmethionine--8-amino-7-oxononanoate transaminase [Acidiferrobacteraceae bacterium]